MAARRDRERRKPAADRRYRFAAPELEQPLTADDALVADAKQTPEAAANSDKASRRARALKPETATPATRGGARMASLPFMAYRADYAYVGKDLRRVGLVIGSLLVILLLLYFVLPR
jgi:hypothetical protein